METAEDPLGELLQRFDDDEWLAQHFEVIKAYIVSNIHAFYGGAGRADKALSALMLVFPYVLLRADLRGWWLVLQDALEQVHETKSPERVVVIQELLTALHIFLGEPAAARAYLGELEAKAENDLYHMLRVYALLMQIEALNPTNAYDKQVERRVLELLKEIEVEETLEAEVYQALAFASIHHGAYRRGRYYAQVAYERQGELLSPNRHQMARTALMIAESYRALKRFDEALHYCDLALAHVDAPDTQSDRLYGLIYHARGLCYFNSGQTDDSLRALEDLNRALEHFQKLNSAYYLALGRHSLGLALAWSPDALHKQTARDHLTYAHDFWEKIEKRYPQAEALYALANIAEAETQLDAALRYLERASAVCQLAVNEPALRQLCGIIKAGINALQSAKQ